jgi:two-component system, NarL family, nitrate/nitrite response regulator NarL
MSELTARQRQIVTLLAQGMSNKEIARMLSIGDGTVKVHLHQIFERPEVMSRAKLIARFTTFEPTFSEA